MSPRTQDAAAEQSAEQLRRKRKEKAAKSRAPEPKNIVSGAGQPLDPGLRRELEEQLGHELGLVRLHGVPLAADGSVALDALSGLPPLSAGLSARRLGQELARAVHQGLSGVGEVSR
jgi:hypothetical protein